MVLGARTSFNICTIIGASLGAAFAVTAIFDFTVCFTGKDFVVIDFEGETLRLACRAALALPAHFNLLHSLYSAVQFVYQSDHLHGGSARHQPWTLCKAGFPWRS